VTDFSYQIQRGSIIQLHHRSRVPLSSLTWTNTGLKQPTRRYSGLSHMSRGTLSMALTLWFSRWAMMTERIRRLSKHKKLWSGNEALLLHPVLPDFMFSVHMTNELSIMWTVEIVKSQLCVFELLSWPRSVLLTSWFAGACRADLSSCLPRRPQRIGGRFVRDRFRVATRPYNDWQFQWRLCNLVHLPFHRLLNRKETDRMCNKTGEG